MDGIVNASNMTPPELLNSLLKTVREQFYAFAPKRWPAQQQLVKHALTWPARWFSERNIDLTAEEYERFILDRLQEVKRHGATDTIKFFPRYLLHVLQEHCRFHEDALYTAAKSRRNALDRVLSGIQKAQKPPVAASAVPRLAELHAMLTTKKSVSKKPQPDKQISLL